MYELYRFTNRIPAFLIFIFLFVFQRLSLKLQSIWERNRCFSFGSFQRRKVRKLILLFSLSLFLLFLFHFLFLLPLPSPNSLFPFPSTLLLLPPSLLSLLLSSYCNFLGSVSILLIASAWNFGPLLFLMTPKQDLHPEPHPEPKIGIDSLLSLLALSGNVWVSGSLVLRVSIGFGMLATLGALVLLIVIAKQYWAAPVRTARWYLNLLSLIFYFFPSSLLFSSLLLLPPFSMLCSSLISSPLWSFFALLLSHPYLSKIGCDSLGRLCSLGELYSATLFRCFSIATSSSTLFRLLQSALQSDCCCSSDDVDR